MRNRNIGGTKEVFTNVSVSVSNANGFLTVKGKLPAVPLTLTYGVYNLIVSAGSAAFDQYAVITQLLAGYTGAKQTIAGFFINNGGSTGSGNDGGHGGFNGNVGVRGLATLAPAGGVDIGVHGYAAANNGGDSIGGVFNARFQNAGRSIGSYSIGGDPSVGMSIGGVFALGITIAAIESAVILGDSCNFLIPLMILKDRGTRVFSVEGGGGIRIKAASLGSVTLDNTNHVIRCDASAGAITLTLPVLAAANRGIWYRIKKIDATANTVTIAAGGADTIDGAATSVLATQYQSEDVIAPDAGTDWAIFGTGGSSGSAGATGAQGIPGKDGEDGQDGFPGIAGPAGANGINGIDGIIGPQGEQGELGEQGPPGPKGDTGANGVGGGTFGQVTADFGTAAPSPDSVTVAVIDAAVTALSRILCTVQPGTGRDLDELELGPVLVYPGDIVAGVGFNIIAVAPDSTADGSFLINYTRN